VMGVEASTTAGSGTLEIWPGEDRLRGRHSGLVMMI